MDAKRWSEVKSIFDEACEMPKEHRSAFIREACGDDVDLVDEIESLLKEDDSVHRLLDGVALDAAGVLDRVNKVGNQVGPYILKRQLGVGGMGEVYLGERADGQFEHQVAVKLVRSGAQSERILARFRSERQILARLQHPNIARLLDGGLADGGVPYFVMEYVDGRPIDQYADESELDVEDRLRLFDQVCRAVTYAHANLIVHRDLKPSNVLVTEDGTVKLLDFGIAKVLEAEGESEPLTQTGSGVLTPAYASPEQARGQPVNTSTDIYSLGVILYELLTGMRPYDVSTSGPLEAARLICEQEPERPSTKVGSSGRDSATAHGSDTGRLRRLLAGDLDVICLRALRKEPERRYTTTDELGDDIRRHLAGRPIEARSESVAYRTGKFVRRHRVAVAFAVLAVAMSGFYTVQLAEQRDRARLEAQKAQQVSEFLKDVFAISDPTATQGEALSARQVLDEGAARLETELEGQPEVLGDMLDVVGDVYQGLGLNKESLDMHLKALETRRQVHGERHADVALSMRKAGEMYRLLTRYPEADSMFNRALAIRRDLFGPMDIESGEILAQLGYSLGEQFELAAAESVLTESLEIRRRLAKPDEDVLTVAMNNLARVYHGMSRFDLADSLFTKVARIVRATRGDVDSDLAAVFLNHAHTKREMGDLEAAEALLHESLAIREKLYEPDHSSIGLGKAVLGRLLVTREKYEEAEVLLTEALEIDRSTLGPEHAETISTMSSLSVFYTQVERYAEADSLRRILLDLNRKRLGDSHPWVAADWGYLSSLQLKQDLYDEAAESGRNALRIRKETLGDEHHLVALDLNRLGRIEMLRGNLDEAEQYLEAALDMRIRVLGEDHERVAETRELLRELESMPQ